MLSCILTQYDIISWVQDGSLITVGGPGAYLWNGMDFCKIL